MRKSTRLALGATAAVAALSMVAGPAMAHECYNASRSANGNTHAANGSLYSLQEILSDPEIMAPGAPLCQPQIDFVLAGLAAEDFRTDVLINFHATQAGGLANAKGEDAPQLSNGKGVDHLSEEFFGALFPLVEEAYATVSCPV